ncbi:MAG TPA: hypothetical protein VLU96_05520 [Gaiellaceae bacterium]|nr:hypothetical protein [Gaiellaceae bacterium]
MRGVTGAAAALLILGVLLGPSATRPAGAQPARFRILSVSATSASLSLGAGRVEYGTSSALALWSRPARGGKVVLTGLLPHTRYLARSHGSSLAFKTRPAASTATRVSPGGTILLNGSPFFPVMQWLQCPSLFSANVSLGINVFLGRGCDNNSDASEVDALERLGAYSVLSFDAAVKGKKGLFGWRFDDEPDDNGESPTQIKTEYQHNRAADPRHVNFLTLTSGFYSAMDPPSWMHGDRSYYRAYAQATDASGFDIYPVTGWCRPDWLPRVGDAQRELQGYAGPKKPTYQWIEATSTSSQWCTGRGVTAAELRAEVWLAIADGARAIGYFTHSWKPTYSQFRVAPDVQAQIRKVDSEISTLAPALLAATAGHSCPRALVCKATTLRGARYLLAVNPSRSAVHGTFRLVGARRSLRIFGARGRVAASHGVFSDTLPALGARIYVSAPAA